MEIMGLGIFLKLSPQFLDLSLQFFIFSGVMAVRCVSKVIYDGMADPLFLTRLKFRSILHCDLCFLQREQGAMVCPGSP
jgi:hypothetical protein